MLDLEASVCLLHRRVVFCNVCLGLTVSKKLSPTTAPIKYKTTCIAAVCAALPKFARDKSARRAMVRLPCSEKVELVGALFGKCTKSLFLLLDVLLHGAREGGRVELVQLVCICAHAHARLSARTFKRPPESYDSEDGNMMGPSRTDETRNRHEDAQMKTSVPQPHMDWRCRSPPANETALG